MSFKSGFIGIIGKPNAGKSTLMNALVGEKLSIITSKEQTTRHKILGILTTDNFQMIFTDTPGIIESKYSLHKNMMTVVEETTKDADVLIVLCDGFETDAELNLIAEKISNQKKPMLFVLSKLENFRTEEVLEIRKKRLEEFFKQEFFTVSALAKTNLDKLLLLLEEKLPVHEAFYPLDELSDKSERFFVAEMIREKIFEQYKKEIPYSTEVQVIEFKDKEEILVLRVEIYVERESQKAIILGHNGAAIKKLGTEARKEIEIFMRKKIFLETTVKVKDNWRNDDMMLKYFGYKK